jgi:hypothetical protein
MLIRVVGDLKRKYSTIGIHCIQDTWWWLAQVSRLQKGRIEVPNGTTNTHDQRRSGFTRFELCCGTKQFVRVHPLLAFNRYTIIKPKRHHPPPEPS